MSPRTRSACPGRNCLQNRCRRGARLAVHAKDEGNRGRTMDETSLDPAEHRVDEGAVEDSPVDQRVTSLGGPTVRRDALRSLGVAGMALLAAVGLVEVAEAQG